MERNYVYGTILFILALFLQFIPVIIPALIAGIGIDIWSGDVFQIGIYAFLPAFWEQTMNNLLMPITILVGGLLVLFCLFRFILECIVFFTNAHDSTAS